MTKTYFNNIKNIIEGHLRTAKKIVRIAVAWINFQEYRDVFEELLIRKVKLEIITNDIQGNNYIANVNTVNALRQLGAMILIKNYGTIMHHKFCIIDEALWISGSFNWTKAANENNLENIVIR